MPEITLENLFAGREASRLLFDRLRALLDELGPTEMRVSKSQVAFRRRKPVALAWIPGMYLNRAAAPLVLTLSFRERDPSPRWKQVVEPAPGRFTHHLELHRTEDLDDEVRGWLAKAWEEAG
jgi:hypothetical protein